MERVVPIAMEPTNSSSVILTKIRGARRALPLVCLLRGALGMTQTTKHVFSIARLPCLVLALAAAGCIAGDAADPPLLANPAVQLQCPAAIQAWAPQTKYATNDLVAFEGAIFQARAPGHTSQSDWLPPVVPSLWLPVTCSNGAPPTDPPPTTTPGGGGGSGSGGGGGQCSANGRPGPLFDIAGAKNVGNGHGVQFIGGQCLHASDCASGCCALPCGICSGPGAQFQNGKQGCGFGG
jgi:hypothetical protein